MKRLMCGLVAAAALAGCSDKSAENEEAKPDAESVSFGYVGSDVEQMPPLYFVHGLTTNWVPARVIRVSEKYEFSENEKKLVAAFGLIESGAPLKEIPSGYVKREVEPWFTCWVRKDTEAFGQKGTAGFVAHYDPDKEVWETGEAFFSTYHTTPEEAMASLEKTVAGISGACAPLKFHKFEGAVAAEYRRLRVIAVVGACANGDFACMLSVSDKNLSGCGEWVPVEEQREMRASYLYAKAVRAWDAKAGQVAADNHKAVEKACADRKLALFGKDVPADWARRSEGVYGAERFEEFDWKKGDPRRERLYGEKRAAVAAGFGVAFGEAVTNAPDACFTEILTTGSNDLFVVDMAVRFIDPPEAKDGEPPPPEMKPVGVVVRAVERLQKGFAIPPYPQPPDEEK